MEFEYSPVKDEILFRERGITFADAISAIADNGILLDFEHPSKARYPDQRILVVNISNYPWCIPYVKRGNTLFLKTLFPARRFKYLIEDNKT